MGKSQTQQATQDASGQRQLSAGQSQEAFGNATRWGGAAFKGDKATLATNPFADPGYIKNLNLLTADSMDAAKNDTNEALTNYGTRTGTNAAYIGAAAKENGRELARTGVATRAKQSADDYGKWQQMRMQALQQMGQLSGEQGSLATGQGSNAVGALSTQASLAKQPGFWSQFGQSMLNSGATVGAAELKGGA